jgi:type IV pilus assembly protein PilA
MMKTMLKNQHGLTLKELLAVVVILWIIAVIAVPSIGNVIDKTDKKATVSEVIQIINAAKIARTENPASASFDQGILSSYLDNVDDDSFTVKYKDDEYSIAGYNAAPIIDSTATKTTETSESDLISYGKIGTKK